jgi:putative phosphoesterase
MTSKREFLPPLVIGVLSDTHIYPHGRRHLPPQVAALFARFGCGLILHAGDVNTVETVRELTAIAPVIAVTGNNDDRELQEIAPDRIELVVGRFRVAMVHGHGGASARAEARRLYSAKVDLVVYGHSHIPMMEVEDGTTFFNPGSPTDRRWQEHFGIGLITFVEDRCTPELILFNDPIELDSVKP